MLEPRPNTIGSGPAQVGATAAIAVGFTNPFFAARTSMVAACPPPKTTKSFPEPVMQKFQQGTLLNKLPTGSFKQVVHKKF